MTDTTFPTGFSHLTSVSTSFTVYADNGTTGGYITVGDIIGLAPVQSVAGRTGAVTLTTSDVSGLTAMATLATAAQGSVVYMGASGPAVLAPGTSGFVLQTNGASANPSWIALGGGGTITGVTAGTGLSGGGSSGTVTVTLGQATTGALGGVTFSATNPAANGSADPGNSTSAARANHVHPTDTTRAPLASPVFTGSMTLPTWATAGRPGSPAAGMEGWNTDLVRRETWNGSAWVQYVRTGDLPSATTSQLYGGTGAAGAAAVVTIGSGLSLSGGTLTAPGGGSSAWSRAYITGNTTLTPAANTTYYVTAANAAITLNTPATDALDFEIKRWNLTGTVTITGNLDGAAGAVITMASGTVRENALFRAVVSDATLGVTTWQVR